MLRLLQERLSQRGIARALGVGTPDHSGLAKKKAQQIEARLENESLALPCLRPKDDAIEIDELCLRQSPCLLGVACRFAPLRGRFWALASATAPMPMLEAVWEQVPAAYRAEAGLHRPLGRVWAVLPGSAASSVRQRQRSDQHCRSAQHQMASATVRFCAAQLRGSPQHSR